MNRGFLVKSFKATDYNDYNRKLGLFNYGYLHRLLDLIYKVHIFYNIPVDNSVVTVFESETGNQVELNNTMLLDVRVRVKQHKKYFKEIWAKRTGEKIKIYGKQLKLF